MKKLFLIIALCLNISIQASQDDDYDHYGIEINCSKRQKSTLLPSLLHVAVRKDAGFKLIDASMHFSPETRKYFLTEELPNKPRETIHIFSQRRYLNEERIKELIDEFKLEDIVLENTQTEIKHFGNHSRKEITLFSPKRIARYQYFGADQAAPWFAMVMYSIYHHPTITQEQMLEKIETFFSNNVSVAYIKRNYSPAV